MKNTALIILGLLLVTGCESSEPEIWTPDNCEYEYVDLGLPSGTLWSFADIGAESSPYAETWGWGANDREGKKYAWGELNCRNVFTIETYEVHTLYSLDNISGTKYDVANYKLGGDWQMPDLEDFEELINNCTMEWKDMSSVALLELKGPNGNHISIKIHWNSDRFVTQFWSGESVPSYCQQAYAMEIDENGMRVTEIPKYEGCRVRPVIKPKR
ncbi:MAG: hypothetical protein K2H98_03885 [Duncaniella sp.]|nr:hypothetical protein [Duncaniella sp.]